MKKIITTNLIFSNKEMAKLLNVKKVIYMTTIVYGGDVLFEVQE